MDNEQLEIFVRVATLKSFTRAAESLYLSQPTISARIKSLENELGVTLFDRSRPRDLTLTEQGLLFWDYAQQMLNLYNSTMEQLKKEHESPGSFLRIGASSVPGIYILPRFLSSFKKAFPQAKIAVFIKDSAEIVNGIAEYTYDIGMAGSYDNDPRLNYIEIAGDELILITSSGLITSKGYKPGSSIPLEVCLDSDFIMREPGSATRNVLEQMLNKKGYSFNSFRSLIYIDNLETIKQAVKYGLGVSVVSRRSVNDYLAAGFVDGYQIDELNLKRNFYIVHHRNRVLNNVATAFLSFISELNEKAGEKV